MVQGERPEGRDRRRDVFRCGWKLERRLATHIQTLAAGVQVLRDAHQTQPVDDASAAPAEGWAGACACACEFGWT